MYFGGFEGTRLKRLLKKPVLAGVLKGRTFRCAVKLFIFVIPSGLQPARDLRFGLFQQPLKPCSFKAHQVPHMVLAGEQWVIIGCAGTRRIRRGGRFCDENN